MLLGACNWIDRMRVPVGVACDHGARPGAVVPVEAAGGRCHGVARDESFAADDGAGKRGDDRAVRGPAVDVADDDALPEVARRLKAGGLDEAVVEVVVVGSRGQGLGQGLALKSRDRLGFDAQVSHTFLGRATHRRHGARHAELGFATDLAGGQGVQLGELFLGNESCDGVHVLVLLGHITPEAAHLGDERAIGLGASDDDPFPLFRPRRGREQDHEREKPDRAPREAVSHLGFLLILGSPERPVGTAGAGTWP